MPGGGERPPPRFAAVRLAGNLDRAIPGSVAGYQMVELTFEVRPKDGVPFQVKRRFSAGRLGRIEQSRRLDVVYDPANPEQLELI